jgi:preprotein translocase subunit YajC
MTSLLYILLQAEGGGGLFGGGQFFFLIAIMAVFYFFMIRPQQKRQKEEKTFREALTKGDRVKTIGGIYGEIEKIEDNSVLLKVDTNVKLRLDKSALQPIPETKTK